jgi:hypothetical protein
MSAMPFKINSLFEKDRLVAGRLKTSAWLAKLRLSLLCISVVFTLCTAEGQEALYNAISLESSIAVETNVMALQPDRPHLGPVQLALGAYIGMTCDDNINESQSDPQSDVISRAGANLGFDWPATDHSELQFGTGIGYVHYLKNTANNGLEINPDSALTYALSLDDVILTFYDQISYSRQVTTEGALANVATLPQFDNTAGVKVEWDPGKWTFQTSYGHDIYLSDSANDYLNRSSEYFFGRAGWRFAEATQAGVEASGGLTAYQVNQQGNNYNYSVGGYVEWQVRPSLHLTLRGGPTIYTFSSQGQSGGNSTLDAYYVSLAASHQLTDFISHSLSINRNVQLGLNQGSDYIEQLTANYTITWALTKRISVGASASYEDGSQPLQLEYLFFGFPIPYTETEHYHRYGGGLQASWQFTDRLSANLSYNRSLRDSNLPERGYTENSVSFGLNYTF